MSTKVECLDNLQKAENSHKQGMMELEIFIHNYESGDSELKEKTPLNKAKCVFGIWFYGEQNLNLYLGLQLYEKIDALHTSWHHQYTKIYHIYFQDEKKSKGIFGKFFKQKIPQLEIDKAKAYFDDLQSITEELLKQLQVARRRINALSDAKFK